jgi:hypothetical protein
VGEHWFLSELHRLKGELLLGSSSGEDVDPEVCFQRALLVAQQQGTRLFELRAGASLARLLAGEGQCRQAHEGADWRLRRQPRLLKQRQ